MQDREVVELRYQVSYCTADGVADGATEESHEVQGDLTEADDDEAHPGLGMTLLPLECRSDR